MINNKHHNNQIIITLYYILTTATIFLQLLLLLLLLLQYSLLLLFANISRAIAFMTNLITAIVVLPLLLMLLLPKDDVFWKSPHREQTLLLRCKHRAVRVSQGILPLVIRFRERSARLHLPRSD